MKNTSLSRMEKACVLLFDEMKIQNSYDYDKKHGATLGPSKYVQVVMARGICGNWKQPIFYAYDRKVYAINSDLGGAIGVCGIL